MIKPARKLNTFSIHSALFKIKQQKEQLDCKIRDLEDLKTNFNEMDFYLMANSGAIDYMFNANAIHDTPLLASPHPLPHLYSKSCSIDYSHTSENHIASLANIKLHVDQPPE